MRRIAVFGWGIAFALMLGGCAVALVHTPVRPASDAERAIAPGSSVTLKNGLTFTVPPGWTATLAVEASSVAPFWSSERLLLENFDATTEPRVVMVDSFADSTIPDSWFTHVDQYILDPVPPVDGIRMFVGRPGSPLEPRRIMTAQARVPGSALGMLIFGGSPDDPATALRTVWKVFKVQGIELK